MNGDSMSQRISFVLSELTAQTTHPPGLAKSELEEKPPNLPSPQTGPVIDLGAPDLPDLPKRRVWGSVACLLSALVCWFALAAAMALVFVSIEHGSLMVTSRRVNLLLPDLLERRECTIGVFVKEGEASRQEIAVALGLCLDKLDQETVSSVEHAPGFVDVTVRRCSDAVFEALSSGEVIREWSARLVLLREAKLVVSRKVTRTNATNTSTIT